MVTHIVSYVASLCGAGTFITSLICIIKHVSLNADLLSLMFMSLLYSVILVSFCLSVCLSLLYSVFQNIVPYERFQDVTVCPEMFLLKRVEVKVYLFKGYWCQQCLCKLFFY
jgi:hypothetical protein